MSALAVYVPRDSIVHRLSAGTKLIILVLAAIGVVALRQPWQVAVVLAVIAVLYAAARIPWRTTLDQVRPLLWFLLALGLFQLVVAGWQRAVVVVGTMLALVLLAFCTAQLLAQIPFDPMLREASDAGQPVLEAAPDAESSAAIRGLAEVVVAKRAGAIRKALTVL